MTILAFAFEEEKRKQRDIFRPRKLMKTFWTK